MSPCEGNNEGKVETSERRKEESVREKEEGVCNLASSLTHLSLKDNIKEIIQLEEHLSSITLQDTKVNDSKESKKEEEEDTKEEGDEKPDEGNEEQDLNSEAESNEKEKEEQEDDEEKSEEKTETEEAITKTVNEKTDKDVTVREKKDQEEEGKEEEEEGKEEEEKGKENVESDDENPTDEDKTSNESQTKSTRFRSRGFQTGVCHGYSPRPYMDYYQQPHNNQMSPQHFNGWIGNTTTAQLASLSVQNFQPSVAENSPASLCDSVESESANLNTLGYEADSPGYYDDTPQYPCNSPQYCNQSSPYYQGLPSAPHGQDSPYYQHQDSPFYQHQDSPQSLYQHQDSPHSMYSPRYQRQDSPQSMYQDRPHPLYQQDVGHLPYHPSQYTEVLFQDSPTPSYSPMNSSSVGQTNALTQSLLTPPVSPQPTSTIPSSKPACPPPVGDFICSVINSVMEQGDVCVSPHERSIIEIKKNLLDIGNCSSDIEDDLDERIYDWYYKELAKMENEKLMNPDEDGDILYVKAACTDQCSKDYKEKLVAFTKRVEMMDLCCDKIVNWKEKICQECGNADTQLFYSPLSWKNNHGEMLLSSLVHLQFPAPVVEYITRKVMNRPIDLKRTFIQQRTLLTDHAELYPCLKEGLRKVQ